MKEQVMQILEILVSGSKMMTKKNIHTHKKLIQISSRFFKYRKQNPKRVLLKRFYSNCRTRGFYFRGLYKLFLLVFSECVG